MLRVQLHPLSSVPTTNLPTQPGQANRTRSPSSGGARALRVPLWWAVGGAMAVAAVAVLVWRKEREHFALGSGEMTSAVRLAVPAGGGAVTYPLPDGSRVTLAPGSSLTSRGAFGESARTLDLTGEALFNVAAATAPLVVYAAGVRVRDVSTAFAVRSITAPGGGVPRALVTVTQGEVQVSAGAWQGALREGEAILVDSTGQHGALGADVVRGSVAWTSGALLFADEPLVNAVERLERWTGFAIAVDPELRDRRLSIALEAESPASAVQHVADALGARAARRGDGWILTRR